MPTSAPRNTRRLREAGAASRAETRRRLLEAAGVEFTQRGYHSATVTRIAARAGVTVQTLYLAWGSKRALLRAFMEAALSDTPGEPYPQRLPRMLAEALAGTGDATGGDHPASAAADDAAVSGARAGESPVTDARAVLDRFAEMYRHIAERAATGWHLYRDAAATDPAIAEDWQALQHLRRDTMGDVIDRLPAGVLRAGLSRRAAADTAWAIASPETYDLLVRTAGRTLDDYEAWVAQTLAAALLRP